MKNRANKIRKHSIQNHLLFYAVCFILPIILFLVGSNFYAMRLIQGQVAASDRNTVELYARQLEEKLETLDDYLINIGMNNISYSQFGAARNREQQQLAGLELKEQLDSELELYADVTDGVFFYQPREELYVKNMLILETVSQQEAIKNYIIGLTGQLGGEDQIVSASWLSAKVGGSYYLFRIYYYKNVYYGSWCNVERMLEGLLTIHVEDSERTLLLNGAGEALGNWEEWEKVRDDLRTDFEDYYMAGPNDKYLVIAEPILGGEYSLTSFILNARILSGARIFGICILALIGISVALLALFIRFARRQIAAPLEQLSCKLKEVEAGDLNVSLPQTDKVQEFALVNSSFNGMVRNIKDLKIQVYEEMLQKQSVELEFLQLQTNPHFFLNAISMLHNYARLNMIQEVKSFCSSLIRHLRYALYGKPWVTVGEELEFIQNYLEMQRMKHMDTCFVDLKVEMAEGLEQAVIPILVIQTFVENSLKYGETEDGRTTVHIKLEKQEEWLQICIYDEGRGFQPEVLKRLAASAEKKDERRHIGIQNVKSRLKLLYGDKAQMRFFNREKGGAAVELKLEFRLQPMDEEAVLDESSDGRR